MVNFGDLFIRIVAGLAMPLAMLDGYKALAGSALQERFAGTNDVRRPLAWILAVLLGPGLFVERMLSAWRDGALSPADRINALVIAVGWAALHGYVVLGLARSVLPV